jgi:2-dehydro-3-deoxygluconokinase
MIEDGPSEVVTLGECLVAFVAASPGSLAHATVFERHIAGAEANVAVGLARLGHRVAYIGRIGPDGFGAAIHRTLRGEGVDVRDLVADDAPTAVMFRERRIVGAAEVAYHRSGSAGSHLSPDDVDRVVAGGAFDGARWLHLTGITPALSVAARDAVFRARDLARSRGLTISFDVNLRRRLWSDEVAGPALRAIATGVDVVLGSPDELAVLAGRDPSTDVASAAHAVLDLGVRTVVAKLGADGAFALETGGEPIASRAVSVPQVIDPVGAGDAFCAGYIAGQLDGVDLPTALRMANACGALAVAALGDQSGLPDRAELGRLLAADGPDTLR